MDLLLYKINIRMVYMSKFQETSISCKCGCSVIHIFNEDTSDYVEFIIIDIDGQKIRCCVEKNKFKELIK